MYHHEHQKKDIRRLVMLTKSVFYDWETDSVEKQIQIANRHRDYRDK